MITRVLKDGLRVSKLSDIGSTSQLGKLDLDGDRKAPWQIDWSSPKHPSNREVVVRWIRKVMEDDEISNVLRMQSQKTDMRYKDGGAA